MADEKQEKQEQQELKVNQIKYGRLRDDDVDYTIDGTDVTAIHVPTGINVSADTKGSVEDNWDMAQQALHSALEYAEASAGEIHWGQDLYQK